MATQTSVINEVPLTPTFTVLPPPPPPLPALPGTNAPRTPPNPEPPTPPPLSDPAEPSASPQQRVVAHTGDGTGRKVAPPVTPDSRTKSRNGSPNYTKTEMVRLCDVVAEVLPLGANEWAIVAARFEEGRCSDEPFRDQDSLRKKFDKLASNKKSTGDPSCLEQVRKAKHAARDIVGRASAGSVGESSSEDDGTNRQSTTPSSEGSVGTPARKRDESARGVKRKRSVEELLVENVSSMSQAVTKLVENMTAQPSQEAFQSVDDRVEKAVENQLRDTKRILSDQSAMMTEMFNLIGARDNQ